MFWKNDTRDLSVCESASLSLQSDQVCDVMAVTNCHLGHFHTPQSPL